MAIGDYIEVELPEDAIFKISPSSIAKFFEYPVIWFKEQILGEKEFTDSTATVLGKIVHHIGECYAKNENVTKEEISKYITKYKFRTDVNTKEIELQYPDMGNALVNEYISKHKPIEVEKSMYAKVKEGIYVGGTADNITKSSTESLMVVDYKTTSTKPKTDKIPWNYYIQAMAYAWMLKQQGLEVDRIRIVWIVKPTKTLPVRIFKVTQIINEKDYQAIEEVLEIIADTILLSKSNPELNYLLFKSMQLKESK